MLKNKKILSGAMAAALLSVAVPSEVYATRSSDIAAQQQQAQQQAQQAQSQLNQINSNISELTAEEAEVQAQIADLTEQITTLLTDIEILEGEIEQKKADIEQATIELEAALEREQTQYNNAKSRVQAMYEMGNASYMGMLMNSGGIGDILTRMEYVTAIHDYDMNLFAEYKQTRQEVEMLKAQLEEEESELEEVKHELEEEKAELESQKSQLKAICAEYDSKISAARAQANKYAAEIKKQNDKIKALEKERKAAIAAEQAALRPQNGQAAGGGTKKSGSQYTVDPNTISNASGSQSGKDVANYAVQFVGNPYVAGGTSLTNGCDCSGFTSSVYAHFGISIPRTSSAQRSAGREVSYQDAQPGDIVCYPGHVGIYIGGGQIVHASTEKTGIKISPATYRSISSIRRIL